MRRAAASCSTTWSGWPDTPGVEGAAAASQLPLEGFDISFTYRQTGREVPPSERPVGDSRVVSPGYFATMGIRLLRGRTFDGRDRRDAARQS